MKHNILQFNTKDFDFIITPITLKTNKLIQGIFTLQLEKGCQHIANLDQCIKFGVNQTYFFTNKVGIIVKTFKQSCMNISWSLYKNTNSKLIEFVDVFGINLEIYYNQYVEELKKHHFQYSKINQNKTNRLFLEQHWKQLKSILKHTKSNIQLKNSQGTFIFDCAIEIKNQFDHLISVEKETKGLIKKQNSHKSLPRQPSNKKLNQATIKHASDSHLQQKKEQEINVQIKINGAPQKKTNKDRYRPPSINQKTVLSDIIEVSVQQSRHQTTDPTDNISSNQAFLMVNQKQEIKFIKTSTFHFQNQQNNQNIKIKRINSLQSPKRKNKLQDQVDNQDKQILDQTDIQGIQIATINFKVQDKKSTSYSSLSKLKYLIFILLILALGIYTFHHTFFTQQQQFLKQDHHHSKKRRHKSNKFKSV